MFKSETTKYSLIISLLLALAGSALAITVPSGITTSPVTVGWTQTDWDSASPNNCNSTFLYVNIKIRGDTTGEYVTTKHSHSTEPTWTESVNLQPDHYFMLGYTCATTPSGPGSSNSNNSYQAVNFTISAPTTPTPAPPIAHPPARILFSGEAFPGATISINLVGETSGDVVAEKFSADNDGFFSKEILVRTEARRVYSLTIQDKDGNFSKSKFFAYDLNYGSQYEENIIVTPTIVLNKSSLAKGEPLFISGYATPGNKVEVLLNDKVTADAKAGDAGYYRILVDTNKLILANYKLQIRQTDTKIGKASDPSQAITIRLSSFIFSGIDFNGDTKVDIQDWSIFLSNWSSQDEKKRKLDDLNGDGKVDVSDFSVFLNAFQLAR